ncbi:TPA: phosphohydrolase [Stenotrophomonas maltophilia]
MDWVTLARTLATEAHTGQIDKAGQPYICHVARVAAAVRGDDDAEVVAWLHDVAEDCPAFAARIEAFPAPLREAVQLLNRDAAPDADSYYARIAAHPLALKVKQADLDDNADPHRLAMLDAATAGRLRGKYAHARAALGI